MTPADLVAFEADIAEHFNAGDIRAPIHLSGGNEDQLISYFGHNYHPGDWVCTTWRSHYHCILAGVPPAELKTAILAGRSITLCFPKHRVISSAIVGGILPIALGIALGIKRQQDMMRSWVDEEVAGIIYKQPAHVHVFVGDMTARTGAYHEATSYARCQDLPITFVTEDNGKSVLTNTIEAWGTSPFLGSEHRYTYELPWPHAGAGRRVEF